MIESIDLNPNHLATVKAILAEHVPECEVRAFGSRATWTARDYSDLDLAIVGEGPLDWRTMSQLREAFEESDLPMRVDILDWHTISESFGKVIERDYQPMPRSLLGLMPDEARLRQSRRLLARYPGPVFLALEEHVANASADDRVWRLTATPAVLSLSEALAHMKPGGRLPTEPPLTRLSLPGGLFVPEEPEKIPGHLLPAALKPADKRLLDRLSEWPWITADDLSGLLELSPSGVSKLTSRLGRLGLVSRVHLSGRRRLALSRRGLALLARRDRASVSRAIARWSVEPAEGQASSGWRSVPGARSRPLARAIKHTEGVHHFMAALTRQAKRHSGFRVLQVSPPHHAARYFRHRGRLRSIHPDGFGVAQAGERTYPFFLEWERRAVNPSTMSARLAPYLRYYSSKQPLDDHGVVPLVLVVFDDSLAPAHFLRVARNEMERTGVNVPLWVSDREVLERVGPLGQAWRNTDTWDPTYAFE